MKCITPECKRWAQHAGYCITHSKEAAIANSKATKKYNMKVRQTIVTAYGGKCICCGEAEPLFLQLDHIANDGAMHRELVGGVRNASQAAYRDVIRRSFPDGYQILCANCNVGKQLNNGICPHKKCSTQTAS